MPQTRTKNLLDAIDPKENKKISKFISLARNLFQEYKLLVLIIMSIFAFRSSVLDWNQVSTESMSPTIIEGDRVFVEKSAYDFALPFTNWKAIEMDNPSRGEIVVFKKSDSSQLLIKRIVGLPEETIEIVNNKVIANKVQADYKPLQSESFNHLDLYTRTQNEFALEIFEDAKHSIMIQKKTDHTFANSKPVHIPKPLWYEPISTKTDFPGLPG